MPTLHDILDDPLNNGVYRLTAGLPEMPEVLRLDARPLGDKAALLKAIGRVLEFPDYYGVNWDALEECLFDLSWHAGQVVLLLEHAECVDFHSLATLVDIWGEAAQAWAEVGRGCVLLLQGVDMPELPQVE